MDKVEINKLLERFYEQNPDFLDCKVELIKSGNNRSTYLLESKSGKKLILKKSHAKNDLPFSSLNDVRVQTFIKSLGYDFVPEIIFCDKGNEYFIEAYVGEENIKVNDMSDELLEVFAKQLAEVHKQTFSQYQEFCKKNDFEVPKAILPEESLKIFGFNRFEIVEKLCEDKEVVNCLKGQLNANLELLRKNKTSVDSAHLLWGIIGNEMRFSGDKIYFVGWEFSRVGNGSELSFMKIHSGINENVLKKIIALYSKYSGKTEEELYEEIKIEEKITRVNDAIWATMKWCESETEEDKEKYKELTFERLNLTKFVLFSLPFWFSFLNLQSGSDLLSVIALLFATL